MAGSPKSGPPTLDIGTGTDFTLTVSQGLSAYKIVRLILHQVVHYVERILDAQEAVGAVLLSLGDWNWRMGDGMPITKSDLGPGDEQIIIEHFMCTSFLLASRFPFLSWRCEHCLCQLSISKPQKRPFFRSIYLLNNVAHLRMPILLEPRNKNIIPLLSRPARDALNSNFRLAKSEYFNSNFMSLLGVLADERRRSLQSFLACWRRLRNVIGLRGCWRMTRNGGKPLWMRLCGW